MPFLIVEPHSGQLSFGEPCDQPSRTFLVEEPHRGTLCVEAELCANLAFFTEHPNVRQPVRSHRKPSLDAPRLVAQRDGRKPIGRQLHRSQLLSVVTHQAESLCGDLGRSLPWVHPS
ncbi:MAG: hypothetical protein DCC46_01110 [Armatimonadetes bacterium]|nr:MAG: hypothetical protein DCC46_01110 [Armatimonadota bacterium]